MNINQIKGPMANTYVINSEGLLLVVDVPRGGIRYVTSYMTEILSLDPGNIVLVICTHDDPDHSGGVLSLAGLTGAAAAFPDGAHNIFRKLRHNPLGLIFRPLTIVQELLRPRWWKMYVNPFRQKKYERRQKKYGGRHLARKARKVAPDYLLRHNDPLPGFPDWFVIHTPGHSWDSCCFFHPKTRTIITGDTVLGSMRKGALILPSIYSNPWHRSDTITLLKELGPEHIYPGHGSSFHGSHLLDHFR